MEMSKEMEKTRAALQNLIANMSVGNLKALENRSDQALRALLELLTRFEERLDALEKPRG
jgi:hypothetical protein